MNPPISALVGRLLACGLTIAEVEAYVEIDSRLTEVEGRLVTLEEVTGDNRSMLEEMQGDEFEDRYLDDEPHDNILPD